MVAGQTGRLEVALQCPLWVKSRHRIAFAPCPLYPRKRTLTECIATSVCAFVFAGRFQIRACLNIVSRPYRLALIRHWLS